MLISYTSDTEVIICTEEKESTVIEEYFTQGGRKLEDYDREHYLPDILTIHNKMFTNLY